MIKRQFNDDIFKLVNSLKTCLTSFLTGSKPEAIISEIRGVARGIQVYSAKGGMDSAVFPFIVADGGILGDMVSIGVRGADPIFDMAFKNAAKKEIQKKRSKKKIAELTNVLANSDLIINEYIIAYIDKYLTEHKLDKKKMVRTPAKNAIRAAMKQDKEETDKIIAEAIKFKSNGRKKLSKKSSNKFIDDILDEQYKNEVDDIRPKKKKVTFKKALGKKTTRKKKVISDSDEEEDEVPSDFVDDADYTENEVEEEDVKSEPLKSKYTLRKRIK